MIITGKKFSKPEMSRIINGDKTLKTDEEKPEVFRLDHILMEKYPDFARATLQHFITDGRVSVDGKICKKSNQKFEKSAEISVDFPDIKKSLPKLNIIYEDSNILVVEKPAGMLSMAKGDFCPEPTLEDYGLLVHRLDRDTSGVVILAKDEDTRAYLRNQFQSRTTHKTYHAIIVGHPKRDEALIDLPIARNLKHPTTFIVDPSGKPSETYYRVLSHADYKGKHLSLVELKPKTGRTHQLRVHMAYLGTPIYGDPVYGKDPASRLFLHASSLEISIPDPNDKSAPHLRKTFTSPLAKDFTDIFPDAV